ncbi:hypothetical protein HPB52_015417 [Rhipicephalus sanguineus]|uniref:Uncharacterized protein n=1 Tax=Rhipicephalus sanguineus TaxID=34632 RepID=A0A9D4PMQ1_RHISA|nr:hypothetical protein HPB52_015417 [Rhipicephalus sanguineus]
MEAMVNEGGQLVCLEDCIRDWVSGPSSVLISEGLASVCEEDGAAPPKSTLSVDLTVSAWHASCHNGHRNLEPGLELKSQSKRTRSGRASRLTCYGRLPPRDPPPRCEEGGSGGGGGGVGGGIFPGMDQWTTYLPGGTLPGGVTMPDFAGAVAAVSGAATFPPNLPTAFPPGIPTTLPPGFPTGFPTNINDVINSLPGVNP